MTLVLADEGWKHFIMLMAVSGESKTGGTSEQTVSTHLFLLL